LKGHDGVAVTLRSSGSGNYRSAVLGGLVAAALTLAPGALVFAQNAQAPQAPAAPTPPAAGPAVPVVPPQTPVQSAAPAPPQPATAGAFPPQPPPPAEKRGFLNDFGRWWDKSVADFGSKMKEQQSKLDDFNKQSATATQDAMKNAADAMHLSRVVEMHEVCATAGNGAPDCGPVVTNACRAKGFKGGEPVDIRTAEKCSASLWVSGQAPTSAADCPVETVVLRAACQ
jgi:hypothetical protein